MIGLVEKLSTNLSSKLLARDKYKADKKVTKIHDIKFEIIKKIGVLSKSDKGWTKEFYGLAEEEIAIVEGKA